MTKKKISIIRLLFVLYLIAVAFLCFWRFQNVSTVTEDIFGLPIDKVAHFFMFLPFPLLAYSSIGKKFGKPTMAIAFVLGLFLLGCAVAASTEIIQGSLPYRTADLTDFRADAFALAVSSLAVFVWDLCRKK